MKLPSSRDHQGRHQVAERRPQNLPPPVINGWHNSLIKRLLIIFLFIPQPLSDTSSAGSPPAIHRNHKNSAYDLTDISDFQQPSIRPCMDYILKTLTFFLSIALFVLTNSNSFFDRCGTRYYTIQQYTKGC